MNDFHLDGCTVERDAGCERCYADDTADHSPDNVWPCELIGCEIFLEYTADENCDCCECAETEKTERKNRFLENEEC